MKTIKSTNPISYEHFAKTYLMMAKIALVSIGEEKSKFSTDDKFRLDSGLIFIPVIFCIRHSIEVFLKSVAIWFSDEFYKTHDLKKLEKILYSIKIPKEGVLNGIKIVDKYTNYKFSKKITESSLDKNDIELYDVKNEVFRFPDNTANIEILGENLKHLNRSIFQEDIEKISSIFNKYSSWGQIERHEKNTIKYF